MKRSRLEHYNGMQQRTVKHILIDWIMRHPRRRIAVQATPAREARRPNIGLTCDASLARNLQSSYLADCVTGRGVRSKPLFCKSPRLDRPSHGRRGRSFFIFRINSILFLLFRFSNPISILLFHFAFICFPI